MKCDYIILPDAVPEAPPHWIRLVDGYIVQRGKGERWRHPAEIEDGPIDGRALLVLPPHATTLHWIACPEMTVKQGAQAARVMALEASVGTGAGLHAAVMPAAAPEESHVVAVTSESAMAHWIDWCAERGMPDAIIVPGALMLPQPDKGFMRGQVGPSEVARGLDSAFDASEPPAALLLGREPITDMSEPGIDDVLRESINKPPLNLRSGVFAARTPRVFNRERIRRIALLVGFIFLVVLLVSLVRIVRLNFEASSLDAKTVEVAGTVVPGVTDAADAELKVNARYAARGGGGGFTGAMAGLMGAMRGTPAVSLSSVNQSADGALRVQLSAARAEDINAVLLALQDAGWRISADAVQQQGGKVIVNIQVVR
jgi:general secretion pathway protein L